MKLITYTTYILLLLLLLFAIKINAQETLPIYSDYLSDNVYLVHPAAAGIGNCAKLRLTHRQQWAGIDDSPALQTISYHTRISNESKVGLGGIIFKDKNGFHSQLGVQGTFAYHIDMGGEKFNQLSFALSGMFVENKIDESNFLLPGQFDQVISNLVQSKNYYNFDFGMAYHFGTGFSYFTVKNLLFSARDLEDRTFESLNIRRYLLSFGYYFDNDNDNRIKWEPSFTGQYIERTQELFADFNIKAYRKLAGDNTLWAVLSYRKSFEGNPVQELTQFTPIIGINLSNVLISYTYTHQLGKIEFENGGYHQFTLGLNLFCRSPRGAACPNINSSFR